MGHEVEYESEYEQVKADIINQLVKGGMPRYEAAMEVLGYELCARIFMVSMSHGIKNEPNGYEFMGLMLLEARGEVEKCQGL